MSRLQIVFIIGIACMIAVSMLQRKKYNFSILKTIIINILLFISGVLGTKILFFIENGTWIGLSFYGAVFFIPIVFFFVACVLKIPYGKLMDFSVAEVCIMLCVMKINCMLVGCCVGIDMFRLDDGTPVSFPSQILEGIVAFIIMIISLYVDYKGKNRRGMYPLFLVLYGLTRFVLNFFRFGLVPFVWIIPAGHFWSLVSVVIGVALLIILHSRRRRKDAN